MKRLTIRNSDGSVSQPTDLNWAEVLKKLADYEDAEEQGRLVMLPCKVGDTVYINTPSGVTLCEVVDSITKPEFRARTLDGLRGFDFAFHKYGKTVFLTREEAEKALKEEKDDGDIH